MLARVPPRYSRAEYISDAVVHISGIALALIGGPILVTLAAVWLGDVTLISAMTVYVVALVAMLVCSALYNMASRDTWYDRLRRIDQSAIYLKIAGTYTPFAAMAGVQAGWFIASVWSLAVAGISIILIAPRKYRKLSIPLYLLCGWAGVIWGGPVLAAIGGPTLWLLAIGGLAYTGGVVFLLWERLPFHNTIWHVFVLAGTGLCYAALMVELVRRTTLG